MNRRQPLALDMPIQKISARLPTLSPANLSPAEPRSDRGPLPFVKWAGGKRTLLTELIARRPADFGRYFEPFVGGGALFFAIEDRATNALLSDSNLELVITYNVVRKDPDRLIAMLEEHTRRHSKDYYYRIRAQHNTQDPIKIAARFIYLNKTCYNGLYRVNKKGNFNVPIGRYAVPSIYDRDNIMACHKALRVAQIEYRDFELLILRPGTCVLRSALPSHRRNSVLHQVHQGRLLRRRPDQTEGLCAAAPRSRHLRHGVELRHSPCPPALQPPGFQGGYGSGTPLRQLQAHQTRANQ